MRVSSVEDVTEKMHHGYGHLESMEQMPDQEALKASP